MSLAPEEAEWVEIIEPRTKEHMYANLTTGECVWDPPPGVPVKRTNDHQWWELFDQNTSRFYYYNATTQKTVWHRPEHCDIIPLAKLQTLKQNTEVKEEDTKAFENRSAQTSSAIAYGKPLGEAFSNLKKKTKLTLTSLTQTSPVNSPRVVRKDVINPRRPEKPPSPGSLAKQRSLEGDHFRIATQLSLPPTQDQDVTMVCPHCHLPPFLDLQTQEPPEKLDHANGSDAGKNGDQSRPYLVDNDFTNNEESKLQEKFKPPLNNISHRYKAQKPRRGRGDNNGTWDRFHHVNKMSPLQQYILEQAKLSGYRFGDGLDTTDRDSFVESEDDWMNHHDDSDDFADDEDGGVSDDVSKASSIDGEDDRYLTEPTYNNLDPKWIESMYTAVVHRPKFHLVPIPALITTPTTIFDQLLQCHLTKFRCRLRRLVQVKTWMHLVKSLMSECVLTTAHKAILIPAQCHDHRHMDQLYNRTQLSRGGTLGRVSSRTSDMADSRVSGSMLSVSTSIHSTISCESDIEKYAMDNLNIQKKGLFRKKLTVKDILTHSKEALKKPLTCLADKALKKDAVDIFRLMQIYMGDRRAKQGMTINSVALEITHKGYSSPKIRDEIYVQLCKQTTENLNRESLRRGWELMAICLSFFPPSVTFSLALHAYIHKHRDPGLDYPDVGKWPIHVQISHYAGICAKRLDRIGESGRLSPKKPVIEDIDQSRLQIFRPSMFGGTLTEILDMQRDRFPHRKLPWILTTLAEQIIQLNGLSTEGIFRVPADLDEVNNVKTRFDQWEIPACADCHTAASLLKLWFRELYEPIIPDALYEESVQVGENVQAACDIVARIPPPHHDILLFLIRFLQLFASPEVAQVTKMDASNLSTVFAPNCLRCPSSDPSVILENTRKEMAFVKALVFGLDTTAMEGVL
ncbi:hypothetical protein TCAL_06622 [Tigriopus californicus]|uniref:Rho GTPase-activating protein 39 n=1 Tax=Tigriopus californicus TaxID=6832 RepID=A0A553PK62_TIGCA|nr:hypothetical protein TCAL_06622 [Tigriopus californicus]